MTEEANDDEGDNAMSSSKSSMFNKPQPSTSHQHPSMFNMIGKDNTPKSSVFGRLRGDKQPKPSVSTIIKAGDKSPSLLPVQDRNSVFNHFGRKD